MIRNGAVFSTLRRASRQQQPWLDRPLAWTMFDALSLTATQRLRHSSRFNYPWPVLGDRNLLALARSMADEDVVHLPTATFCPVIDEFFAIITNASAQSSRSVSIFSVDLSLIASIISGEYSRPYMRVSTHQAHVSNHLTHPICQEKTWQYGIDAHFLALRLS